MMQSTLSFAAIDAYVPELAPLVILAFLGTAFLLFCAAIGAGVAAAARRPGLAKGLGAVGLTAAVVYSTLLLAASLLSHERTLAPGERKYFCEMDCHIAYEVTAAAAPDATTRVVTVRAWFDPSTIAPFRGNGPLSPNPRIIWLVDDAGRHHEPDAAAAAKWDEAHGSPSAPLDRELRPGESYTTTLAFTVPPDARRLRLFIGSTVGPERLLIGHEYSPLHGKIYFALPAPQTASR
jgi:hypothetical protein